MLTQILIIVLVAFGAGFAAIGLMLLTSVRKQIGQKIQLRMKGVHQIRDYELGDALAAAQDKQKA